MLVINQTSIEFITIVSAVSSASQKAEEMIGSTAKTIKTITTSEDAIKTYRAIGRLIKIACLISIALGSSFRDWVNSDMPVMLVSFPVHTEAVINPLEAVEIAETVEPVEKPIEPIQETVEPVLEASETITADNTEKIPTNLRDLRKYAQAKGVKGSSKMNTAQIKEKLGLT